MCKKIIAVKDVRKSCPDDCLFKADKIGGCENMNQTINGVDYNCDKDNIIYKEDEEVKLDFSGISTEKLRTACKGWDEKHGNSCKSIGCKDGCPFYEGSCKSSGQEKEHTLFKEELNRREKGMNKQPTLEAGQIVKMKDGKNCLVLMSGDNSPMYYDYKLENTCRTKYDIMKIYNKTGGYHYGATLSSDSYLEKCTLIWSRKSDKDIEIEEIQKAMDKLNKRMEGLKS